jgi:type I restriction enzyme S subunit
MEVKAGYKQTDVGVIPEDWDIVKLGKITSFVGSGKTNTKGKGEYPLYGSTGLIGSCSKPEYIGEAILVARVGANAGKLNLVNGEYGVSDNTILLKFDNDSVIKYYQYSLIKRNLNSLVFGSGQPLITGSQLKDIVILKPTKKEQTVIATALSDVDALIESLDKLIVKKRNLKQATMQVLLTGKTRLPGFSGIWKKKSLREMFVITAGGDLRKNEYSEIQTEKNKFPIFSNAINNKGLYGYCSSFDYEGEYLTITARGGVGHAVSRYCSFCAIGRLLVLNPLKKYSCKFFEEYINQFIEFANESTGVPQLTAPQVAKYYVIVPDIDEQNGIAKVISDMDAEIEAIEKRRDKTINLKIGMMQVLLTGKTRLV